jgi:hypothetical protein
MVAARLRSARDTTERISRHRIEYGRHGSEGPSGSFGEDVLNT